jgi:hypothetical protein
MYWVIIREFSDFYVNHRTRKGNFLSQIDQLIDWNPIEQEIRRHYAPVSDVVGRPVDIVFEFNRFCRFRIGAFE